MPDRGSRGCSSTVFGRGVQSRVSRRKGAAPAHRKESETSGCGCLSRSGCPRSMDGEPDGSGGRVAPRICARQRNARPERRWASAVPPRESWFPGSCSRGQPALDVLSSSLAKGGCSWLFASSQRVSSSASVADSRIRAASCKRFSI